MRIEQLYYFLDVAQSQSITKSASNLFISPQGLSQSIASLEKEYGITLFERSKTGIFLNDKGLEFRRHAMELCERHQYFERNVAALTQEAIKGKRKKCLLRFPPLMMVGDYLPSLIDDLEHKFPSAVFSVDETHLDQVLEEACSFAEEDDFIGIVSVPDFRREDVYSLDSLVVDCFLEMPVAAKVHCDSTLANRKLISRKDFSVLPIVCFNEPVMKSIIHHLVEDFGEPNIVMLGSTNRLLKTYKDAVTVTVAMAPNGEETVLIPLAEPVMINIATVYHMNASQMTKDIALAIKRFLAAQFPLLRVNPFSF